MPRLLFRKPKSVIGKSTEEEPGYMCSMVEQWYRYAEMSFLEVSCLYKCLSWLQHACRPPSQAVSPASSLESVPSLSDCFSLQICSWQQLVFLLVGISSSSDGVATVFPHSFFCICIYRTGIGNETEQPVRKTFFDSFQSASAEVFVPFSFGQMIHLLILDHLIKMREFCVNTKMLSLFVFASSKQYAGVWDMETDEWCKLIRQERHVQGSPCTLFEQPEMVEILYPGKGSSDQCVQVLRGVMISCRATGNREGKMLLHSFVDLFDVVWKWNSTPVSIREAKSAAAAEKPVVRCWKFVGFDPSRRKAQVGISTEDPASIRRQESY